MNLIDKTPQMKFAKCPIARIDPGRFFVLGADLFVRATRDDCLFTQYGATAIAVEVKTGDIVLFDPEQEVIMADGDIYYHLLTEEEAFPHKDIPF